MAKGQKRSNREKKKPKADKKKAVAVAVTPANAPKWSPTPVRVGKKSS